MTVLSSRALPAEVLALQESLDAVELFLATGGDGAVPTMRALLTASQRLEGLSLRAVHQVDLAGTWTEYDVAGCHALVQQTLGSTDVHARATVRLARRLDSDLAPIGDLLRAGRITRAHAAAVVHGVRGLDPDVVASSLEALSAAALCSDPVRLAAELRERAQAISEDLAKEQRRRLEARKGLTVDETPDGAWLLGGLLGAEDGALFNDVLDRQMEADRVQGDPRTGPRRRLDALLEVIRHYAGCHATDLDLPRQGSNRAHVVVLASSGAITGTPGARPACLLGTDNALLTHAELLRLMCDADISTVTLSPDGVTVNWGRSTRTVTRGQWLALCVRDRTCVVKGCRRRPSQCQAHHVIWWRHGGRSDLGNYVLLCHVHHHDLHDRAAWLLMESDLWLTPDGVTDGLAPNPPPRFPRG